LVGGPGDGPIDGRDGFAFRGAVLDDGRRAVRSFAI